MKNRVLTDEAKIMCAKMLEAYNNSDLDKMESIEKDVEKRGWAIKLTWSLARPVFYIIDLEAYYVYVDTLNLNCIHNKYHYTFYGCGETEEDAFAETEKILEEDKREYGIDYYIAPDKSYIEVEGMQLCMYEISKDIYNLLKEGEMWNLNIVDGEIIEEREEIITRESLVKAYRQAEATGQAEIGKGLFLQTIESMKNEHWYEAEKEIWSKYTDDDVFLLTDAGDAIHIFDIEDLLNEVEHENALVKQVRLWAEKEADSWTEEYKSLFGAVKEAKRLWEHEKYVNIHVSTEEHLDENGLPSDHNIVWQNGEYMEER